MRLSPLVRWRPAIRQAAQAEAAAAEQPAREQRIGRPAGSYLLLTESRLSSAPLSSSAPSSGQSGNELANLAWNSPSAAILSASKCATLAFAAAQTSLQAVVVVVVTAVKTSTCELNSRLASGFGELGAPKIAQPPQLLINSRPGGGSELHCVALRCARWNARRYSNARG